MDSNLLKVFLCVATLKSFSKAALELDCAQSNVTARIKQLEKNIGFNLFHRVSKGVVLTDVAIKLLPLAQEIIQKIQNAEQLLLHMKHSENLKIGSTESNAATRIITLLSKIDNKYPNMKLELTTGPTQEIKELLLDYKIDIGFISGKPLEKEFKILKEYKEKIVLLKSLKKEPAKNILTFKKGCTYRKYLDAYLKQQQLDYKNIEFGSLETILGCVKMGMGITILPLSFIQRFEHTKDLEIKYLPKEIENIHTYMICRVDNEPLISSFLKKLEL
ncbi:LysR family transcriptional regulator [Malaciobacter mytili]|uniref:LysR family transcriptional regulator n=1 Tax=Malaciobacter mytili TaxID=603050 RepID=UPI00100B8869|nr:LysR family transcriptional regulator [Malaciobacter mytili]RXI43356.1 LysR family transcriptional regulator [Malaciobacter mytili]